MAGFRGLQELIWFMLSSAEGIVRSIGPDLRATPEQIPQWGSAEFTLPELDVAETYIPKMNEAKEI